MKFLFVLSIVLAVSCSTFGAAENNEVVVVRSRRDLMEHSMKLIQDLVANLRKAAEEALEAVGQFTAGLVTEAEHIRDKILQDIDALRKKISAAVEAVYERISNTSSSVKDCVDSHRNQAGSILEETVSNTMDCVDNQISNISKSIQDLKSLANDAITYASGAMNGMKNCTDANTGFINTGTCLASLALQTEVKTATFLAKSGFLIAHINIAITSLPVTLEMCAGRHLLHAGVQTGKIALAIGSCSASAVFTNITG